MSDAIPLPRRWGKKEPLAARKLNEPVDAVRRLVTGVPPIQQRAAAAAATVPEVRQFKIGEILPDYLVCLPWDGTTLGAAVTYVARPPTLRASATSRNGVTFSAVNDDGTQRTATAGADSETQVIIPSYLVGDVIYAVRNVRGGLGVSRSAGGEEKPVAWLDMNVDGRQWAKEA